MLDFSSPENAQEYSLLPAESIGPDQIAAYYNAVEEVARQAKVWTTAYASTQALWKCVEVGVAGGEPFPPDIDNGFDEAIVHTRKNKKQTDLLENLRFGQVFLPHFRARQEERPPTPAEMSAVAQSLNEFTAETLTSRKGDVTTYIILGKAIGFAALLRRETPDIVAYAASLREENLGSLMQSGGHSAYLIGNGLKVPLSLGLTQGSAGNNGIRLRIGYEAYEAKPDCEVPIARVALNHQLRNAAVLEVAEAVVQEASGQATQAQTDLLDRLTSGLYDKISEDLRRSNLRPIKR